MLDELYSLRTLQILSWVCLLVLTAGSWGIMGNDFALSVAAGGVISNLSFLSTQRDVRSYMESIASPGEEAGGQEDKKQLKAGKSIYLIKFWLRILIIGLVLLILIKSGKSNVIGLLLGLSTVVFTITLTSVGHYFFSRGR